MEKNSTHLRPAEGLQVPDIERGGYLSHEGRLVANPLPAYWLRRLASGDVLEGAAAPAAAEKKTKGKPAAD